LLRDWQLSASNGSDQMPLEFGDCTKSRHSKQWWEQPVPLVSWTMNVHLIVIYPMFYCFQVHFASDLVLIALVGLATALQWRRGDSLELHSTAGGGGDGRRLGLQLLLSFSAKRNLQKLVQMPKDRLSTITCFFGLRFGAMVWTLIGHSFIFVQAFLENVDEFKDNLVGNREIKWNWVIDH
jgi:hypothetical protein